MDKRCLLLLLSLSLLLGFLQALRCHQCFRVRPDGSCQHRRAICTAKENEECLQRKYYNALRCFRCIHVRPDGSCARQRTICKANENEECVLMKYYDNYRLFRGYQNCRYNCTNKAICQGTFQMITSCCKENDLCNRM
ncbi:protein PIP-1-like [Elephas maximus indicus]|uniref:protein PIP-1-like n=1 Tax=Elephas maximus indicus TaxID=99487 RepID=UPI0021164B4F|nr:protein PIP-1-like [Elephas maximus indicus]